MCAFISGKNFPRFVDGFASEEVLPPLYVRQAESPTSFDDLVELMMQRVEKESESSGAQIGSVHTRCGRTQTQAQVQTHRHSHSHRHRHTVGVNEGHS